MRPDSLDIMPPRRSLLFPGGVMTQQMLLRSDVPVAPGVGLCRCGHALAGHGRISTRYCEATVAQSLARGCICPAVPPSGGRAGPC
jgi:hypothetical protein